MVPNTFYNVLSKHGKFLTAIMWLISLIIYLQIHGVVKELEAAKYIEEAKQYINTGSFSAPRFYFYCVTIFILAFSLKIKIGLIGAFVIQAFLNLSAFLLFYKALSKTFVKAATPLVIIGYLLAFSPYQSWVVFLYTESVYFSAVLILVSLLILYKPNSFKNILLIFVSLGFALISRPLGMLLAVSIYLYLFYYADKKWKVILVLGSVLMLTIGYFLINTAFATIHDWSITQGFEEESIICDLPSAGPYQKLNLTSTGSPVYHLWYYVTHNFSHFLKFAGIKTQYFFLMTRNYYSSVHNYFLLLNIIPVYLLAFCSFFIKKAYFSKGVIIFFLTTILIYALAIVFQCDDYHNRFILSIYPLFVILAARAAENFYLLTFKNNK